MAQADNLIGGTKRRTLKNIADKYRKKGNEAGAERIEALHRELSALAGMDLDLIESESKVKGLRSKDE